MIKTFCKLFYNNILSTCYDTQKKSQDDIIIDIDKYDNLNIDYKIQKKSDFYKQDSLDIYKEPDNNLVNNNDTDDTNDIDDKYDKMSDIV